MEEGHGPGLSVAWVFAKAGEIFKRAAVKFTAITFVPLAPGFVLTEISGNTFTFMTLFGVLLLIAGTAVAAPAVAIATLGNRDDTDGDTMRLMRRASRCFSRR